MHFIHYVDGSVYINNSHFLKVLATRLEIFSLVDIVPVQVRPAAPSCVDDINNMTHKDSIYTESGLP
jgi:hypothetical protein